MYNQLYVYVPVWEGLCACFHCHSVKAYKLTLSNVTKQH